MHSMYLINDYQIILFLVLAFSILILGIKISQTIDPQKKSYLNRPIYLGEALLLGSIGLIGAFLFLSLISFYRSSALLGVTWSIFFGSLINLYEKT